MGEDRSATSVVHREADLHEIWSLADTGRATISLEDGERRRVLYSGMPGGSYGPDFRNAVIEADDGSEIVGDVEIHSTAGEWYSHGHHSDARYNDVMLHAVSGVSTELPTFNSVGLAVPQAAIGEMKIQQGSFGGRDFHPRRQTGEQESEADWLTREGREWFALKVAMLEREAVRYGADLALQMATFECLGYPRNRSQFRLLARRLPWAFLVRYGRKSRMSEFSSSSGANLVDAVQSLVKWAAGLGPAPMWVDVPRLPGEHPRWVMAAGRPANSPMVRIRAAAWLLTTWLKSGGPVMYAFDAVGGALKASELLRLYSCPRFGLGRARAAEIVLNSVLPMIAALAGSRRDGETYRRAWRMLESFPALPSNSVSIEAERVMLRRGVDVAGTKSALARQGLMHAYKKMLLRPRSARQIELGSLVPSI